MADNDGTTQGGAAPSFDRLGVDALAAAHLRFTELADAAPAEEMRDAWRLAARITDGLSSLRVSVSDVILKAETGSRPLAMVDAVRELRAALDDAATREG
jgi:hypothetical protein